MQTYYVESLEELQEVYDAVAEDFNECDYMPWLHDELDKLADWEYGLFEMGLSPDGQPWAANAPQTVKQKGHQMPMLGQPRNNFRLRNSLAQKGRATTGDMVREAIQMEGNAGLSFGSAVPYGALHDRPGRNRPARRHVGINSEYIDKMTDRLADHTINALAKG